MQDVSGLPVSVGVATRVAPLFFVDRLGISGEGLASLFSSARGGDACTQPLPSSPRDIKRAMEKRHKFSSAHLDVFLDGYVSGCAELSDTAIANLRRLIIHSSCDWAYQCQMLALRMLLSELEARDAGVVPRMRSDEPSLMSQLRRAFPEYQGKAPCFSVSKCHFLFVVDTSEDDEEQNTRIFPAVVNLQNEGNSKCTVKVSEVHTFINGKAVGGDYFSCTEALERSIRRGETTSFHFTLRSLPRRQLSTFEQLIVLSVDTYAKVFVTLVVLSPRQSPFGVGFPQCLALTVRDSPIGTYASPLMLQLLKHQFIRQQGLVSKDIASLLLGRTEKHVCCNRERMREATRVREVLEEEMDFTDVLNTYRSTLPKNLLGDMDLPISCAQPAGYFPGGVLPKAVAAVSTMSCFPNAATRLPAELTNAQPDVLLGLVLIWLAELDAIIFDASLLVTEPMTYLGALPPYLQGVVFWVLDLCAGLLLHKDVNEVSLRHLALTFAAVLMHKRIPYNEDDVGSVFSDNTLDAGSKEPREDSILAEVAIQQCAVNAFVHWITVYAVCYEQHR